MTELFPALMTTPSLFAEPAPTLVRVIDTETAGQRLEEDAVIEIGSVDLDLATGAIGNPMQTLCDPAGAAINPHARRVHHITDEMLAGAPPFAEAIVPFRSAPVYAAQRASFDRSRLRLPGRWLCTHKLALRAFPRCGRTDCRASSNTCRSTLRRSRRCLRVCTRTGRSTTRSAPRCC